jgi:hypothetical protein
MVSDKIMKSNGIMGNYIRKGEEYEPIKEWYMNVYPSDELGKEIKANITFHGLFECLDRYNNVYDFLGIADSTVRERVFDRLSTIMNVGYDYIYDQWLEAKR